MPQEINPLKNYINVMYVLAILAFIQGNLSGPITGVILFILCAYILKYKNWARIGFIVFALVTILLHVSIFLDYATFLEKISEMAAMANWNQAYVLIVILILKMIAVFLHGYGIYLLNRPNIKNLFISN